MENAPIIFFTGTNYAPTPEGRERLANWQRETWLPIYYKDPWWTGVFGYDILQKNRQYPERFAAWFYENLDARDKSMNDPDRLALVKDQVSLYAKYGMEFMWQAVYTCIFGFRNGALFSPTGKEATLAGRAPIIYLPAVKLSPFLEDKYEEWFSHQGYEIYVPLLMKLPD